MSIGQSVFRYVQEEITGLFGSLDPDRLIPYLEAAGQDRILALKLYAWNGRLADALRFPLEITELTLRSRIVWALRDRYGPNWHVNQDFKKLSHPETYKKISKILSKRGMAVPEATVVSNLSFGFWAAILENRFKERLWRGRVEEAFKYIPPDQTDLEAKLNYASSRASRLLSVRNCIAHHDPVWHLDPGAKLADTLQLTRVCCKQAAKWIQHHATVDLILRAKPKIRVQNDLEIIPKCSILPKGSSLLDALRIISVDNRRLVVLDGQVGSADRIAQMRVITGNDIAAWMGALKEAECGLVSIETSVDVLASNLEKPPYLAGSESFEVAALTILRANEASGGRERVAILGEDPATVRVVELFDVVNADSLRRMVVG